MSELAQNPLYNHKGLPHFERIRIEHVEPAVLATLEDAENGHIVEIDTANTRTRQNYRIAAAERQEALASRLRQKGLDWVETRTDAPYMPALQKLFVRRAKRF